KLQKLCYFAYGYHLAWEGRPLFREPFEAWANGPVVYDLYDQHLGRNWCPHSYASSWSRYSCTGPYRP
ncbi:DUF4065 domain-containing protein, partial [Streptomyces sp. A73]|nr:DUF4065 domain-containing protein [Streptomyces sp. A73]